jgi:hypothetical protein
VAEPTALEWALAAQKLYLAQREDANHLRREARISDIAAKDLQVKRDAAITNAVAAGSTMRTVAEIVGVSLSTVHTAVANTRAREML